METKIAELKRAYIYNAVHRHWHASKEEAERAWEKGRIFESYKDAIRLLKGEVSGVLFWSGDWNNYYYDPVEGVFYNEQFYNYGNRSGITCRNEDIFTFFTDTLMKCGGWYQHITKKP